MNDLNLQLALLCAFLALLCLLLLVRVQRLEAEPRPNLRDYFIAHAPAEPQTWFKPTMATARPSAPAAPDRKTLTTLERQDLDALGDFLDAEDMTEPRIREYAQALEEHKMQAREWATEAQKQCLIQWPGAWADAQIALRCK